MARALIRMAFNPLNGKAGRDNQPRAILSWGRKRLVLPFAPDGYEAGEWGRRSTQIDRPSRKPILVDLGPNLDYVRYPNLAIANRDGSSIGPILSDLKDLAESWAAVTVSGLSYLEQGPWRLTSVRPIITRRLPNNAPRLAQVDLTFGEVTRIQTRIARSKRRRKKDN